MVGFKGSAMITNLMWFKEINRIGGVETFYWNLVRSYPEKDIVIYYETADPDQITRLSKLVLCRKWRHGERIKCKRAFFNYNCAILDWVDAEEYIQVVHGDYKALGIKPWCDPRIDRVICVSEIAARSYEELTGRKCEVCYNPVLPPEPQKVLRLVSATRLTFEKGRERMITLAKILHDNGVVFDWQIFTDSVEVFYDPSAVFRPPVLNVADYIKGADYLVQLSSNEGYGYSVVEALMMGVPCLLTPCPVFKEIGIKDGVHGYYLPFDMGEIQLTKILKGVPKFKYTPPADRWGEILLDGKSEYKEHLKDTVRCMADATYHDLVLGRLIKRFEIFEVTRERAEKLRGLELAHEIEGGE